MQSAANKREWILFCSQNYDNQEGIHPHVKIEANNEREHENFAKLMKIWLPRGWLDDISQV